jgi:hypothetical protein
MSASAVPPRARLATLLVILALGCLRFESHAAAQPMTAGAPLFDCTFEHEVRLLEPEHPSGRSIVIDVHSGFVFDAASGIFRWRSRDSGTLHVPARWTVVQFGSASNDWVAVLERAGVPSVLRIRTSGRHPGRFLLMEHHGDAFTGRCR